MRVQGKQQPVAIYEVIAEKESLTLEQNALCLSFAKALAAFRNQQVMQAKILFNELVEKYHDGASALYLQRLITLEKNAELTNFETIYDLSK